MPWCEPCGRFYSPESIAEGGACPAGHVPAEIGAVDDARAPWHFKLMLVALVGYLGYRLVEGILWLVS